MGEEIKKEKKGKGIHPPIEIIGLEVGTMCDDRGRSTCMHMQQRVN